MDEAELEGTAIAAYEQVGLDPDEPRVGELACRLVGPVMRAYGISLPGDAALDDGRILVRPKAHGWRLRWAVAHEVAEWLLLRDGVMSEQQEELADRLAASLLAPQKRCWRACRALGPQFLELAERLRLHPYCAVLRFGEVARVPVELRPLRSGRVRIRGDEWPKGHSGLTRPVLDRVARWAETPHS